MSLGRVTPSSPVRGPCICGALSCLKGSASQLCPHGPRSGSARAAGPLLATTRGAHCRYPAAQRHPLCQPTCWVFPALAALPPGTPGAHPPPDLSPCWLRSQREEVWPGGCVVAQTATGRCCWARKRLSSAFHPRETSGHRSFYRVQAPLSGPDSGQGVPARSKVWRNPEVGPWGGTERLWGSLAGRVLVLQDSRPARRLQGSAPLFPLSAQHCGFSLVTSTPVAAASSGKRLLRTFMPFGFKNQDKKTTCHLNSLLSTKITVLWQINSEKKSKSNDNSAHVLGSLLPDTLFS